MNSNRLVIKQKKQTNKIYNFRPQTGFRNSYFTVRVTTNDPSVPSFYLKGKDRPYRGNNQPLG